MGSQSRLGSAQQRIDLALASQHAKFEALTLLSPSQTAETEAAPSPLLQQKLEDELADIRIDIKSHQVVLDGLRSRSPSAEKDSAMLFSNVRAQIQAEREERLLASVQLQGHLEHQDEQLRQ